jgi:hypothetical protein
MPNLLFLFSLPPSGNRPSRSNLVAFRVPEKAILCGAYGTQLTIRQYLECRAICPMCGSLLESKDRGGMTTVGVTWSMYALTPVAKTEIPG